MTIASLVPVIEMLFPDGTVRLVDGHDPMLIGGELFRPIDLGPGLDTIEHAINGEASMLELSIAGTDPVVGEAAWAAHEAGTIVGTEVRISIQECDADDMPTGDLRRQFTGYIGNFRWDSMAMEDGSVLDILIVEIVNRWELRNLPAGGVLSDADQQLRSPGDKFLERVPGLADKTINWPDV